MGDPKTFRKYQVYFFLYLAVICELLIIIVERDDAELQLRVERDQLLAMTKQVITELITTHPIQSLNGSNQMEVGKTRRFLITLQGMGPKDTVTTQPRILVRRNGSTVQELTLGQGIVELPGKQTNGSRVYAFDWRAPAPGEYVFEGMSGNNRLDMLPTGEVKLASLSFPFAVIKQFVPDILDIITGMGTLRSDLRVTVIAAGGPLEIHGGDIVTAAGFPATRYLEVQGTSAASVRAAVNLGQTALDGPRLRWTHTFSAPGDYTVQVDARDTRDAGMLSKTRTSFRVLVKWPAAASTVHEAYADEMFRTDISVAGLGDRTKYTWTAMLDGRPLAQGNGHIAEFRLDAAAAGKTLVLHAEYDGSVYPVAFDDRTLETSRFSYPVQEAPARLRNLSFSRNGEYAVGQEFRFDTWICGRCTNVNRRAPEVIRVEAESRSGRDLLGDRILEPILDASGRPVGTRVKFYLTGRIPRDGEEVLLTIRADDVVETIPVVIFPD